jgi:hypothetical protein
MWITNEFLLKLTFHLNPVLKQLNQGAKVILTDSDVLDDQDFMEKKSKDDYLL